MKTNRLFFDLETVVNPDAIAMLPEQKAAKNIKDPVKIAAAIEEKTAEVIDMAALDSDLGQIVAVTYQVGLTGEPVVHTVGIDGFTERTVIQDFWFAYAQCNGLSVGYNTLSFDFPYILKRSFDLQIPPTMIPNLVKYRTEPNTDLFQIMNNWAYSGGKKLKWVAKRYGIKAPADDIDGSMVKNMTIEEIREYALSDLYVTVELYKKMNGYYFNHNN
jgi:hypothetical protein